MALDRANAKDAEWLEWAKEYLRWYGSVHSDDCNLTEH